jgi:hypothetical protein
MARGAFCYQPEVVGHVVLGEGGLGRERHVDLQRGGAVHEVHARRHPRRAHRHRGQPAHHQVLASTQLQHGRRGRPGSATQHKQGVRDLAASQPSISSGQGAAPRRSPAAAPGRRRHGDSAGRGATTRPYRRRGARRARWRRRTVGGGRGRRRGGRAPACRRRRGRGAGPRSWRRGRGPARAPARTRPWWLPMCPWWREGGGVTSRV